MEGSNDSSSAADAQSAIIFSSALIKKLEHQNVRLPTTYIGVRQIRSAGGKQKESGVKRKYSTSDKGDDDDWVPNVIGRDSCPSEQQNEDANVTEAADEESSKRFDQSTIVFKVTNPDGTERRMTSKEKRQLKYEKKQANHLARKEERGAQHEERIRIAKESKRERKRMKWLAKKNKKQAENIGQAETQFQNDQSPVGSGDCEAKLQPNLPMQQAEDVEEESDRKYRGNPPVMLTPAATRIAIKIGALQSTYKMQDHITTVFDEELSRQWAALLQESMIPAEVQREKEEIRPMAYKVVPEVWTRLRPAQLINSEDTEEAAAVQNDSEIKDKPASSAKTESTSTTTEPEYSLSVLRKPSPSYDNTTHLIFSHLHQHSNLHMACGSRFGCDYLIYDGRREDRHSFAGMRVHATNQSDRMLPVPSAYDLTGFVRTMNTARKLALIATIVWCVDNPNVARVAIVDLALEKVLTAPTHIKKGNTDKRRCVAGTDELVKRKY
jgi:hypothetical protein